MEQFRHDIGDDEIRVISSSRKDEAPYSPDPRKHSRARRLIALANFLIIALIIAAISFFRGSGDDSLTVTTTAEEAAAKPVDSIPEELGAVRTPRPRAELRDSIIGGVAMTVITPFDATPTLHVGSDVLADSTTVLTVQAADIRRDNGKIVGSYVADGELLSRGQAKAGFCAIIDGKPVIGVAESTPYLEMAIDKNGYFFRQYPLVVAGQIVENRLRGRALRKALAEIDGRTTVVLSHKRLSMHEFSQALVELGVSNAIYLVGSSAYGTARNADGSTIEFGTRDNSPATEVNYIVWR